MSEKRSSDYVARAGLALIAVVLTVYFFCRHEEARKLRLLVNWHGDAIAVYPGRDSYWLLTHLVVYGANEFPRAVAQFPEPVTIAESGGRIFTRDEIDKLRWCNAYGDTQAPPVFGEPVGVMYIKPLEAKAEGPPLR